MHATSFAAFGRVYLLLSYVSCERNSINEVSLLSESMQELAALRIRNEKLQRENLLLRQSAVERAHREVQATALRKDIDAVTARLQAKKLEAHVLTLFRSLKDDAKKYVSPLQVVDARLRNQNSTDDDFSVGVDRNIAKHEDHEVGEDYYTSQSSPRAEKRQDVRQPVTNEVTKPVLLVPEAVPVDEDPDLEDTPLSPPFSPSAKGQVEETTEPTALNASELKVKVDPTNGNSSTAQSSVWSPQFDAQSNVTSTGFRQARVDPQFGFSSVRVRPAQMTTGPSRTTDQVEVESGVIAVTTEMNTQADVPCATPSLSSTPSEHANQHFAGAATAPFTKVKKSEPGASGPSQSTQRFAWTASFPSSTSQVGRSSERSGSSTHPNAQAERAGTGTVSSPHLSGQIERQGAGLPQPSVQNGSAPQLNAHVGGQGGGNGPSPYTGTGPVPQPIVQTGRPGAGSSLPPHPNAEIDRPGAGNSASPQPSAKAERPVAGNGPPPSAQAVEPAIEYGLSLKPNAHAERPGSWLGTSPQPNAQLGGPGMGESTSPRPFMETERPGMGMGPFLQPNAQSERPSTENESFPQPNAQVVLSSSGTTGPFPWSTQASPSTSFAPRMTGRGSKTKPSSSAGEACPEDCGPRAKDIEDQLHLMLIECTVGSGVGANGTNATCVHRMDEIQRSLGNFAADCFATGTVPANISPMSFCEQLLSKLEQDAADMHTLCFSNHSLRPAARCDAAMNSSQDSLAALRGCVDDVKAAEVATKPIQVVRANIGRLRNQVRAPEANPLQTRFQTDQPTIAIVSKTRRQVLPAARQQELAPQPRRVSNRSARPTTEMPQHVLNKSEIASQVPQQANSQPTKKRQDSASQVRAPNNKLDLALPVSNRGEKQRAHESTSQGHFAVMPQKPQSTTEQTQNKLEPVSPPPQLAMAASKPELALNQPEFPQPIPEGLVFTPTPQLLHLPQPITPERPQQTPNRTAPQFSARNAILENDHQSRFVSASKHESEDSNKQEQAIWDWEVLFPNGKTGKLTRRRHEQPKQADPKADTPSLVTERVSPTSMATSSGLSVLAGTAKREQEATCIDMIPVIEHALKSMSATCAAWEGETNANVGEVDHQAKAPPKALLHQKIDLARKAIKDLGRLSDEG
eukprot:TRINITY_DN67122_c0_g1_i1.p1 TRINITY_DN67122_c0_g1~~TRINITY_DN67122_c0_g1_i1.p1  ORF type:complete len:1140 (-),score=120.13 TRINITY_DN67122_c0_g1_i1:122-3541(-)